MSRYDDQVNWYHVLAEMAEMAERDRAAEPVHPTIYVGPNTYEAALEIGYRPEDLTLVTPGGQYEEQELGMVNAAGQQTMIETFAPRHVPIPAPHPAQNDMRPREVDRAKVKAGRKAARVVRRKRGRK